MSTAFERAYKQTLKTVTVAQNSSTKSKPSDTTQTDRQTGHKLDAATLQTQSTNK